MNKIIDLNKILEIYPQWDPSNVAFIKSIKWFDKNILMEVYCQSRKDRHNWPDLFSNFFELKFRFDSVSNFSLNFGNSQLQQVTGFDIWDISGSGLEKINFKIQDYENGIIEFSCERIVLIDVLGRVGLRDDDLI